MSYPTYSLQVHKQKTRFFSSFRILTKKIEKEKREIYFTIYTTVGCFIEIRTQNIHRICIKEHDFPLVFHFFPEEAVANIVF